MIDGFGRTDPGKLRPVELHVFRSEKLIDVIGRINHADGQTVGLGDIIDIVGGDDRSGARHVLHDDIGISGNVFAQILR